MPWLYGPMAAGAPSCGSRRGSCSLLGLAVVAGRGCRGDDGRAAVPGIGSVPSRRPRGPARRPSAASCERRIERPAPSDRSRTGRPDGRGGARAPRRTATSSGTTAAAAANRSLATARTPGPLDEPGRGQPGARARTARCGRGRPGRARIARTGAVVAAPRRRRPWRRATDGVTRSTPGGVAADRRRAACTARRVPRRAPAPPTRKNGTSDPRRAAISSRASSGRAPRPTPRARRRPPRRRRCCRRPRPAATGIRLLEPHRQRRRRARRRPGRAAEVDPARRRRRDASPRSPAARGCRPPARVVALHVEGVARRPALGRGSARPPGRGRP